MRMMFEARQSIRLMEEAHENDKETIQRLEERLAEAKRAAVAAIDKQNELTSTLESMAGQISETEGVRRQLMQAQNDLKNIQAELTKARETHQTFYALPKMMESGQRALEEIEEALRGSSD